MAKTYKKVRVEKGCVKCPNCLKDVPFGILTRWYYRGNDYTPRIKCPHCKKDIQIDILEEKKK